MYNLRLITFLCMVALTGKAGNLLLNSNFEDGRTGFSSDYAYSHGDIQAEASYDVLHSPREGHSGGASFSDHTSGNGLMLAANGSADGNKAVWRETVNVIPGHRYAFSGWIASWGMDVGAAPDKLVGNDPCPSLMVVSINGIDCGKIVQVPAKNGEWKNFAVTWNSGDSTAARIEIRLATTAGYGNDVAIDDLGFFSEGAVSTPTQRTVATTNGAIGSSTENGLSPQALTFTSTNVVPGVQILHAVEIKWPSLLNQVYQVQRTGNPDSPTWSDFGSPVMGNGATNFVYDEVASAGQFYRVLSFQ